MGVGVRADNGIPCLTYACRAGVGGHYTQMVSYLVIRVLDIPHQKLLIKRKLALRSQQPLTCLLER